MDDLVFTRVFRRGLNRHAVENASRFFQSPIGQALLKREDFQLFIRENQIDFYWKGCRVLKYSPLGSKRRFQINRAYMEESVPRGAKLDVALDMAGDDLFWSGQSFRHRVLDSPEITMDCWVKGCTIDRAGEKFCLYNYWKHEAQEVVLDVEIAFSSRLGTARPHTDRIDLLLLNPSLNRLLFAEVKVDSNTGLRSRAGLPSVIEQLQRYRQFIQEKEAELQDSYGVVLENIRELGLERRFVRDPNVVCPKSCLTPSEKALTIAPNPVLAVFESRTWGPSDQKHWERLETLLADEGFDKPVLIFQGRAPNQE